MQTKRLTILITYTHPDQSTQAHLRGQHPMTASEPPANWGADNRVEMISITITTFCIVAKPRQTEGGYGVHVIPLLLMCVIAVKLTSLWLTAPT